MLSKEYIQGIPFLKTNSQHLKIGQNPKGKACLPTGRLVVWSFGCFLAWLVGWLVVWLVGCYRLLPVSSGSCWNRIMLLVAPAHAVATQTRTQRRLRILARWVKGKRNENPRFSNKMKKWRRSLWKIINKNLRILLYKTPLYFFFHRLVIMFFFFGGFVSKGSDFWVYLLSLWIKSVSEKKSVFKTTWLARKSTI